MTDTEMVAYVVAPVAGYLLGAVPFALVIGKMKGVDIRTVGSKNIGATNLGRTLGAKYFWYAFLLDAAKGFLPVLWMALFVTRVNEGKADLPFGLHATTADGTRVILPSWVPLLTAVACVLGHTFPVWLRFKGGKGVATSFGVVLGVWPLYTLAGLGGGLVFVIVLMAYRFISLASIIAALAFVGLVAFFGLNKAWFTYQQASHFWPLFWVSAAFAALIIWRHRANIRRLINKTEPRIGSAAARSGK